MHTGFGSDEESGEHPHTNFDELFSQPNFDALQLLSCNQIVDELRRDSDKLTEKYQSPDLD